MEEQTQIAESDQELEELNKQIELAKKKKQLEELQKPQIQPAPTDKKKEILKKAFGNPLDLMKYIIVAAIIVIAILFIMNTGLI